MYWSGMSDQIHVLVCLTARECDPNTYCKGGWLGLGQSGFYGHKYFGTDRNQIIILTLSVQSSHYTNCATVAP